MSSYPSEPSRQRTPHREARDSPRYGETQSPAPLDMTSPPRNRPMTPEITSPPSPEDRRVRKRKMANVTRPSVVEPQCRRKSEPNVNPQAPRHLSLAPPIQVQPFPSSHNPQPPTSDLLYTSLAPPTLASTSHALRVHLATPTRRSSAPMACVADTPTSAAWVAISKREVNSLIDDVYPSRGEHLGTAACPGTIGRRLRTLDTTPEVGSVSYAERHSVGSVQRSDLLKPRKWKSRLMQRLRTQHQECS